MNSISLDDPDFFKKVNGARPDLFDQEKMAENIAKENAAKTPTQPTDGELEKDLDAIFDQTCQELREGNLVTGNIITKDTVKAIKDLLVRREQRAALQGRMEENERLIDIQTKQQRFGKAHPMHAVDYRNRLRELEAQLQALEGKDNE